MNFRNDGLDKEPQSSGQKLQNLDSIAQGDVIICNQTEQSAGSDLGDISPKFYKGFCRL